jgi:hypothetical protein
MAKNSKIPIIRRHQRLAARGTRLRRGAFTKCGVYNKCMRHHCKRSITCNHNNETLLAGPGDGGRVPPTRIALPPQLANTVPVESIDSAPYRPAAVWKWRTGRAKEYSCAIDSSGIRQLSRERRQQPTNIGSSSEAASDCMGCTHAQYHIS